MDNLPSFQYIRPQHLEEALAALQAAPATARVLAGGTTLIRQLRRGQVTAERLIDIKRLPELKMIEIDTRRGSEIGAAVTLTELATHNAVQKHFPLLGTSCAQVHAWQIRNRSTLGGEICVGSRRSAILASLLLYDASVVLAEANGSHEAAFADFLQALYADRSYLQGKLLQAVRLPPRRRRYYTSYRSLYLDSDHRQPLMGVGVGATYENKSLQHCHVVITGIHPGLQRLPAIEQAMTDTPLDADFLATAGALVSETCQPRELPHASIAYQRAMARELWEQCMVNILKQAGVSIT